MAQVKVRSSPQHACGWDSAPALLEKGLRLEPGHAQRQKKSRPVRAREAVDRAGPGSGKNRLAGESRARFLPGPSGPP